MTHDMDTPTAAPDDVTDTTASDTLPPTNSRRPIVIAVLGLLATVGLALGALALWGDSSVAPTRSADDIVVEGLSAHVEGDLAAAEVLYLDALSVDPDNVLAIYNLGVIRQSEQQLIEAVDLFRRALAIDAEMPSARLNLAWALRDLGDVDEAVAELTSLRSQRPDDALVLFNLGQMLIAAGRIDEGAALVREAIELDESLLVTN